MQKILPFFKGVKELKNFSLEQLEILAMEVRELLINVVSKNGGHLAPNLGVVELTIALHKVLNCPQDKIVWDVGHQAYVHKILTDRKEQFATLRQFGGLSGFPKISESEYDAFGTGHASTSISSALGIALGRDLNNQNFDVVAVIGDGSFSSGLVYEAMNHAGHLGLKMMVVLNDNAMSIAPSVGAISKYLSNVRTASRYAKFKAHAENFLRSIPAIGTLVVEKLERVKDIIKYLIIPGVLFEEMGFTYFGPIDGHNLEQLIEVLENAKTVNGPVLVHVMTRKGKGYRPAEKKAEVFHGIGPFHLKTGEIIKDDNLLPSYSAVFGKTIVDLAEKDKEIVAITAAMPSGTGLTLFAERFPERFFDVGLAEPHAVTMAAGLATQGKKPIVAIYSTFLQRAYDNIVHDVCLQKLPVIFAIDRAGVTGEDGPTHHGLFDFAYLRHIPDIVIMAPKDENELKNMLFTATDIQEPTAIRYPKGNALGVEIDKQFLKLEVGKAEIIKKGNQVTFLAIGSMVSECFEVQKQLAEQGIDTGLVNARFLKPLDEQMLNELYNETKVIIIVEDAAKLSGFGSAVLEYYNNMGLTTDRILCLGLPDMFIEHGTQKELLEKYGLTVSGILDKSLNFYKASGEKWQISG